MTDSRHGYEQERWYQADLYSDEMLNDPQYSIKYLNVVIDLDDLSLFRKGLKRVIEAQKPDSCIDRILEEVL